MYFEHSHGRRGTATGGTSIIVAIALVVTLSLAAFPPSTAAASSASASKNLPPDGSRRGVDQQGQRAGSGPVPTIEEKTAGMERQDGFLPLYWDTDAGVLWLEIPRMNEELIYVSGLSAGLGSNDIGLDRGQLGGTRLVRFERVGRKILMVQPNTRYRAISDNPDETRAVDEAFAKSILWGFTVAGETDERVLVDTTDFLLRDTHNISARLGGHRVDRSRSAIYRPSSLSFPRNTEVEAIITFVGQGERGFANGFGRGSLGAVAPTTEAVTLRLHHSFVQLPDDGYEPRRHDPRSGYGFMSFEDYAVPLGTPLTQRFVRRHRLEKIDPRDDVSDPVEPIIYYLDRGTPEPVRSALLDGARWWNQAFEAAGYQDAFQVKMMPEGAHNLDVRYNVIQWVHRSTRGWSYGSSVTDPRTGEIIKGHVTLGSLRVRQDYLIAEGLLSPYQTGDEVPPELAEWALARIRQLSAHEVGHTIGLGHNYYDSALGRISVLDYPHPWVTLEEDGTLNHSEVYDDKIGAWDKVAVAYGYQHFPAGADEEEELGAILEEAWVRDIRYMTNQDMSANPRVDQWSNGSDPAAELDRMMTVRRNALERFGDNAVKRGMPMATIEEVLVPLYLHHRYQVTAAASAVGGADYIYSLRGDGHGPPVTPVSGARQRAAIDALMRTIMPSELVLPKRVIASIPPRPSGFGRHRELFPRHTGLTFDTVTPAVVAADHTIAELLEPSRTARLVEQRALDSSLPSFEELLDQLVETTFGSRRSDAYEALVARAVERVVVDRLMRLAAQANMPEVRAITSAQLTKLLHRLFNANGKVSGPDAAHHAKLSGDIKRFMARPAQAFSQPSAPAAPPGAPIGEPAMDWLGTPSKPPWSGSVAPSLPFPLHWWLGQEPYCSQDSGLF